MTCPVCGERSRCIDTITECDVIYRKRQCVDCGYVFYTEEIDSRNANVAKEFRELKYKYWREQKLKRDNR